MIKVLFMDVDGTLTDGKIYIGKRGELFKAFNIKDGYGISVLLKEYDIIPIILTGRKSQIIKNRCKELGIERLFQNVEDKLSMLKNLITELKLSTSEVAFIGDDDNDYECIEFVHSGGGKIGCPNDASLKLINHPGIYKCCLNGGCGAVREFIEHIVNKR